MHYQHIFQSTPFLMDFIYLITALSSGGHFKLVILEFWLKLFCVLVNLDGQLTSYFAVKGVS